ncbi:uncharacterized protein LOC143288265 [Babylonia areolata]|uniref:uncharacterized protein LOC143288265 n=1 Tax=Babylonia areolata TaxID=304850 RepID=UPI003FD32CC3
MYDNCVRISAGSNVNCDGDNECVTTATCESNTCRIPAGSDVNCTRDSDCVPPAVCVSMNCTLETTPSPLGEFNKTSILRKLNESEVNQQTVIQTREVLEQQGETTAADVVLVADILHRASQLQDVSQQTATHLLKIVDTVAELNQSVLHESNSVGNTTNRLIVAVEQVAGRVTLPEGTVRLQTNSTVLQVWNLTAAAPSSFLGLLLKSDGELVNVTSVSNQSDRRAYAEVDTAVLLPGEIGHNIVEANPGSDVRLSASVITQTSLFRTVEQADTADTDTSQTQTTEDRPTARARLNSKVISLRITVDGQPVTDLAQFGQDNVTTVFQPLQTISTRSEAERRERTQCVFWDFAEREGRGAWSTEGCHLERFVAEKTVCLCNHLTNFAILMDFYGQSVKKRHESILSSITMAGFDSLHWCLVPHSPRLHICQEAAQKPPPAGFVQPVAGHADLLGHLPGRGEACGESRDLPAGGHLAALLHPGHLPLDAGPGGAALRHAVQGQETTFHTTLHAEGWTGRLGSGPDKKGGDKKWSDKFGQTNSDDKKNGDSTLRLWRPDFIPLFVWPSSIVGSSSVPGGRDSPSAAPESTFQDNELCGASFDEETLVYLTGALIRSKLLYGHEAFFTASDTQWEKLERVERSAIRHALGLPKWTAKDLVYQEAGWLPLREENSKSSLQALTRGGTDNRRGLQQEILFLAHQIIKKGTDLTLMWLPSHTGILGNDMADKAAKEAIEYGSPTQCRKSYNPTPVLWLSRGDHPARGPDPNWTLSQSLQGVGNAHPWLCQACDEENKCHN